jgi:energy-coupling factor transporter ATP-binding protein EcfA2
MSDNLPPHSHEAEVGILGCILADEAQATGLATEVATKIPTPDAFYDLRHRAIWTAMMGQIREQKAVDIIHLVQRLRDTEQYDQVGGLAYLAGLPESAPTSLVNLPGYVDILNEKWLARRGIKAAMSWCHAIDGDDSLTPARLEAMQRELSTLVADSARQFERRPKNLVTFRHFEEAFFNLWFRIKTDEYGMELPFPFPFRIRPGEMTLFSGDNGSGKSSFLGQAAITLALQGAKPCIASMEVAGEVTAWIMSRQLLGRGHLDDTPANQRTLAEAFDWMDARFSVYDFRGIASWRELLDVFRWAREHRANDTFIVDSVMRIGIEDDNFAEQGLAAAAFANFALTTNSHVFLVLHERKSRDGSDKERIRGSKQWSDNAHNVTRMMRNQSKAESFAEWDAAVKAGEMEAEERDRKVLDMAKKWDSKFILSKQRWPASEQNASRWLYFHRESLQFHTEPGQAPFNYLLK